MRGRRMWIALAVACAVLLAPATAAAAGAQVRLLNAAVSGKITIQIDGKTEFSKVKLGRTTRRHPIRAGRHLVTAKLGKTKVVASRAIIVSKGEKLTIVYAVRGRRSTIGVFVEPKAAAGAIMFRAANFASAAGAVRIRLGGRTVASNLRFGAATKPRRLVPANAPAGILKVSARRGKRTTTAHDPLVLATGSVGLFVVIPKGKRRTQVVRLPYTTPVAAPTHQPILSGTRRFDHTVRCTGDHWHPGSVAVKRRWTVDGHVVASGTKLTLTTARDAGHTIACTVSATLNGMTTTASVSFALPAVPTVVTLPSVKAPAGALAAGQTLTCIAGAWKSAPGTFAYRWIRVATGAVIGTARTYKLRLPDDNGPTHALACDVVATNNGGVSQRVRSANTVALGVAPTISLLTQPGNPTTSQAAAFTWAVGGGGADTVECKLDGAAFAPCDGPLLQNYAGLATSINGTSHTFTVRATNAISTASATATWKVNPVAPAVTLGAGPSDPSQDPNPSFGWTVAGGPNTVTCKLGSTSKPCNATGASLSGLTADAAGTNYTFTVTAANVSGTDTKSFNWTMNPDVPTVSLVNTPPATTQSTSASFSWNVGGGGATGVTCSLDGAPFQACDTPTSQSYSGLSGDAVAAGADHTFVVRVTNATTTVASTPFTWKVVPPPPSVSNLAVTLTPSNTAVTDGGSFANEAYTVTFTVTGPTTSITCQVQGGASSPCTSGDTFPNPGAGPQSVKVTATNAGGPDASPPQISWSFT